DAPTMNPRRRPTRFISIEAGMVLRAGPITDIVEGRGASALLLASAKPPRLPTTDTTVTGVDEAACARGRRRAVRSRAIPRRRLSNPRLDLVEERPAMLSARGDRCGVLEVAVGQPAQGEST